MKITHVMFCALVATGAASGCKKTDRDAEQKPAVQVGDTKPADAPSRRLALATFRPLLDEAGRAELDAGGVMIDFGAPDQHKYTRGGWRSGWGASGAHATTTFASLKSRRGFVELPAPRTAPQSIVVRARSRSDDQRLSVFANGRELGTAAVGKDWSVVRVPVADGAFPSTGRARIELRASSAAVGGVRAEVDWLWLATAEGEPLLGPRVLPIDIGGKNRRTLAAPTARTYAFYLQPPPGAELVVDLGATDRADFVITAITDDGKRLELARETVKGAWVERAVPFGKLAGRAVRLELTTTAQQGAVGWGEPELMVPRSARSAAAPAGPPPRNVIVLVMDTARADAFGPFAGADRIVKTPTFDALAAKSTVFAAAYDNENWTKPSVATTLSGLYPSTHGAKEDASMLSRDVELISERLKRDGFTTAGFVANGYVSKAFGFEQGWDVFKNYIRESEPSETEYVFADALAWHAEHAKQHPDKPFFLYLQTIDPHVTYRVDREFWSPYFDGDYSGPLGPSIDAEDQVALSKKKLEPSERDLRWLRALYWGEIAYHDAQLAKLLAELEARHVLDNTLLVITNDHGEELGERGRFGHGHQTFEEMVRAPLIIHYPPLFTPGRVIADIVEHVDLAPTILDALGTDPLSDADGISFMPLVRDQPIGQPQYAVTEFLQSRRVVRVGPWKLFGRSEGGGALFDLAADPAEQHDLGDGAPIARQLCEVHLGEALATPAKAKRLQGIATRRQFRAGSAKIGKGMRRQLEALGYFGGEPAADPGSATAKGTDEK